MEETLIDKTEDEQLISSTKTNPLTSFNIIELNSKFPTKPNTYSSKCFFFHIILIFLIFLITLSSFTYINILNTFLFNLLIIFLFSNMNKFNLNLKRYVIFSIITINIIYTILSFCSLVILMSNISFINEKVKSLLRHIFILDPLYPKNNYMNILMSLLMCIVIIIYYKSCIWDIDLWNNTERENLKRILMKCSPFKNQILSFGLYFICLGASFFPTSVNCFFLLIVLMHFSTLIFKKKWHVQFKQHISFIFCSLIPCFMVLNYIINTPFIYNHISNFNIKTNNSFYGFIILFQKDHSSFFMNKIIFLHILPIIMYICGYFCINLYLNINLISSSKHHKIREIIGGNIDSAIYSFFKESEKLTIFEKIKLFVFKYCYSPSFFLHFCRFGLIIWINTFITYSSYFMIIWVLISMISSETEMFFNITKNVLLPLLILSFSLGYISNIKGVEFELKNLGMIKYKTQQEVFYYMTLGITIVTILQAYVHIKIKFNEYQRLQNEDIQQQGDQQLNKINTDELKLINQTEYVLKPVEILFKFSIVLVDIGLIVFLYFSICQSINIFNEIMLLFIISLFVFSKEILKYFKMFLILLNITFQLKYIVFFIFRVESKEVYSNNMFNFLSILFYDEFKRPYYYWIAYYLLYINYVNQQSEIFRICRAKYFSIYELIENKFQKHINIKYLLNTICDFLFGIYIWLLIPFLITFLLLQENNIFFLIQLLITFIIYYKYIKITGINYKRLHGIFFYTRLMIITSIIFMSTIYIGQFLNKKPFSLWYALTEQRVKRKLELVGLFVFNGNYSYNFIAYIFQFLISVALHVEITRQIKLSKSRNKKILDIKGSNITKKDIIIEKTILKKSYMKKLYTLLYYILHYYWIVIFIVVAILSIHWMLSISMAIELILFSYYIMKSFFGYYKCLNTNYGDDVNGNKQTFSQKMKQYKIQRQEHLKITSDNQESYYNLIWKFTFLFIILAYMSSIALKFMESEIIIKYFSAGMYMLGLYNESKTHFITYSSGYFLILMLFSVRAYIMSKLNEIVNKEDLKLNQKSMIKSKKNHIMNQIIMQNDNEDNDDDEDNNNSNKQETLFRKNKIDKDFLHNQEVSLEMLNNINDNNNSDDDINDYSDQFNSLYNERRNSFDDSDVLKQVTQYLNKNDFPDYFSNIQSINNNNDSSFSQENDLSDQTFEFKRSESICIPRQSIKEKPSLNSSSISLFASKPPLSKPKQSALISSQMYVTKSKDDTYIRYQSKPKKLFSHSLAIQIGFKRFIEILIVILVLVNAVIKMNILSFVLIICVITTYSSIVMSIKIMFNISLTILTLFIIQYVLFLSNISYDTNPFVDSAILTYVEDVFYIPWCKRLFGFKWASFFSCGVIRYHINSLWIDVLILIICYFYLEFFSFSIYESSSNKDHRNSFEKYFWKFQKAQNISQIQLRNFQRCMKLSYDIELTPSLGSNHFLIKTKSYKETKNRKLKAFKKIRGYLYLSFHYIALVFILLVALLNRGIISLGYTTFSIYYIYKAHNFLQGRSWTFSRGIRLFLKPYLVLEIVLQFIFQIPLDVFKIYNNSYIRYMQICGFATIVDYSSTTESINKNGLYAMILKVLMYFIVLLQEIIYNSYYFKQFILKYHYEYIQMAYIRGTLHSYLFNNYRVKLMNDRLEERDEINDTLSKIEGMIYKWNNKLNTKQDMSISKTLIYGNDGYKKKNKKKKDEMTISQILKKYWMISIATNFYLESRFLDQSKIRNKKEILRILNGGIVMNSLLEDQIEKFENDNYDKYSPALERIRNTKKKNKEEQKNNVDLISKVTNINPHQEEQNDIKSNINEISLYRNQNSIQPQDQDNESFFASCDYFEIKAQIRKEFFSKYYSKSKLIIFILKSNLRFLKENFEYVCFFFMILNHFMNCSLISVIYPILVFIFGITQYPRPDKLYWRICMMYCSSIILVKFFFQLNIWEQFDTFSFLFQTEHEYFKRIGIKQFTNLNSNEFLSYVLYDFLLLCVFLTNQFMLIRKGLWNETEVDYETIEEANARIHKHNGMNERREHDLYGINKLLSNEDIVELIGRARNNEKISIFKRLCDFYSKTFTAVRNEKPGKDYYLFYTIIQFFILVYIIIFYTQMEQDKLIIDLETFQVNQFSGKMVLFAFVHLILLVFDRFIFLKNSRKVTKIAYKVYNKQTGEDVTSSFEDEYSIKNNYDKAKRKCEQLSDMYSIVCYQYEGMQVGLICKFLVQVFTVMLIHFYIFCYFPIEGNRNLQFVDENTNNEFLSNSFLIVFYILYIGYFILSGMQIKYGLPDMRKKSSLMGGSKVFFSVCFKGFKAVPFLFELKNFIDWTFTSTAFDIFKWLKYEEIFALLYINKCFAKSYMGIRVGSKSPLYMKILIGGSLVTGVLLVIFVPLVLFSTLNPSNSSNDVINAKFKIDMCVGNNEHSLNFTLMKSTNAKFTPISDHDYEMFLDNKELKGYTQQQIQNAIVEGYSDKLWSISGKSYDVMKKNIELFVKEDNVNENEHFVKIVMKLAVIRANDLETTANNYVVYDNYILSKNDIKLLFYKDNEMLPLKQLTSRNITLTDFYSPYMKVPSDGGPSILIENRTEVNLGIHCDNNEIHWTIFSNKEEGIHFITFSDLYSSATAGYNILTFYVAFVLVVGQYIRLILMGQAERVIYTEMVNPNKLLTLCEGIRISRIKKDFLQEGRLYYLLIDLMRSPEMVKSITKSSLVFIQEGNIIKDDTRAKVNEVESVALLDKFNEKNRKAFH